MEHQVKSSVNENLLVPIAIIVAGALVAGAIIWTDSGKAPQVAGNQPQVAVQDQPTPTKASEQILSIKKDDHIFGNKNADIVIIEYSDLECPFCKRFHDTMTTLTAEDKSIAWVYRHFPLDAIHPKARKEGEAVECAFEQGGNEAFWTYVNRIFAVSPLNNGLDAAKLPEIAQFVGLDVNAFNTCLSSGKMAERVARDANEGAQIGVRGTPYSIIWNRKTGTQVPISGAYPIENVKQLLAQAKGN